MKLRHLILFVLNLMMFLGAWSQQAEFYVDPLNGSDSNQGTSVSNAFKTIEKAKQAVAKSINNECLEGNIIVYLRGGVHLLDSTIIFTNSDSGTNDYFVIYKNYDSEIPVISCGEEITGSWQTDIGSIKKINIGTGKAFRQIYINDSCMIRARTPNFGSVKNFPASLQSDGLNVEKGLLDGLTNWEDKVELVASCKWMHKRLRITNKYNVGSYTRAVINNIEWDDLLNEAQGVRKYEGEEYWVENAYEFLDQAGEWYYNEETGWLYYWPLPGENIESAELVIPKLENAFFVNGGDGEDFESPVSNLMFEGLTFKYNNYTRPNDFGFVDVQANTIIPEPSQDDCCDTQYRHNQQKARIPAVLSVYNGKNITVKDCSFYNLGGNGLTFNYGGKNILINSNKFVNISGNAIEVGNDANQPNDDRMIPKSVVIYNNYIENIAKDYRGGVGIICFYIDGLIVKNNEIFNVPYSGISLGWGWGDHIADPVPDQNRNYTILYNKVSELATYTYDAGGIYTTNPVNGTNIIENNYVKNQRLNFGAYYFDGHSANWTLNKNVAENAPYWTAASGSQKGPINATDNYTTTSAKLADNWTNSSISGTTIYVKGNEPTEAQSIIDNSGLTTEPYSGEMPPQDEIKEIVIIDNGDSGYSENGTWGNGLEGYDGSGIRYGTSTGASATWTPSDLSGSYAVYIYKLVDESGDSNALIEIAHKNGTTTKYLDFTSGTSGWKELGTYEFGEGSPNYVKNIRNSSGYIRADAVKFETGGIIIDNGDPGYSETGSWENSGLSGNNGTSTRYGTSSDATVSWTPGSLNGKYTVYIYKVVHANSDSNAKIEVSHVGGTDTHYIDYTEGSSGWVELGTYTFSESIGSVNNSRTTNGTIRADAVKFVGEGIIINNEDSGYSEEGDWHDGDIGLSGSDGSDTRNGLSDGANATWSPSDLNGCYRVYIYKVVDPSGDSNAKIEIMHRFGTETKYLDFTKGDSGWVELGEYDFYPCGSAVKNTKNSDGLIRADAVKFESCSIVTSIQEWDDGESQEISETNKLFNVYPNPVNEILKISSPSNNETQIIMYNINGVSVYNDIRTTRKNEIIQIDVSTFKTGIYFLKIDTKKNQEYFKVIVNH